MYFQIHILKKLLMAQLTLLSTGFIEALENPESPGILFWIFPGMESPGKRLQALESPRNLLNSRNKIFQNLRYKKYLLTARRTDFEISVMKGCKVKFGVLEKLIRVVERSLKFVSEKGYESCLNSSVFKHRIVKSEFVFVFPWSWQDKRNLAVRRIFFSCR